MVNGGDGAGIEDGRQLVVEFTELLLRQAAPDELPVLDEVVEEYFEDPDAALGTKRHEEPLALGVDFGMLAPYAIAVGTVVVQFLGTLAADMLKDEVKQASTPIVTSLLRKLFRRPGTPATEPGEPALTSAQGKQVREAVLDHAAALRLPQGQALLLADAVHGSLRIRE